VNVPKHYNLFDRDDIIELAIQQFFSSHLPPGNDVCYFKGQQYSAKFRESLLGLKFQKRISFRPLGGTRLRREVFILLDLGFHERENDFLKNLGTSFFFFFK
jgi:hypothetical protein